MCNNLVTLLTTHFLIYYAVHFQLQRYISELWIRVKHFTCTIEIHASWIWCPLFSSRIYGISCYFAGKKLQNEKKVKVGKSWPFFGPFLLKTISCRRRALLFVYCLSLKNDNIYSAAGYYLPLFSF